MRRQIALANACLGGRRQNRANRRHREGLGDHTQADVVGDPRPLRKGCNRSRHRRCLLRKPGAGYRKMYVN